MNRRKEASDKTMNQILDNMKLTANPRIMVAIKRSRKKFKNAYKELAR